MIIILGTPLLFVIYINGLFNLNVSYTLLCLADDTLLLVKNGNLPSLQNMGLCNV